VITLALIWQSLGKLTAEKSVIETVRSRGKYGTRRNTNMRKNRYKKKMKNKKKKKEEEGRRKKRKRRSATTTTRK